MKNFIIYDRKGEILRVGFCPDDDFFLQTQEDEFIIEGSAKCIIQKIVNGKVIDKTPDEIEADYPKYSEVPEGQQLIQITKKQWQDVLRRIDKLEKEGKRCQSN